jgi:uncharacterized OsmC-like protein
MSEPLIVIHSEDDSQEFRWSARVRWREGSQAVAYCRNFSFTIEQQASFKETDPYPSAVEYLLGALAGDLLAGFANEASRHKVSLDALEARVSGYLSNPLVYLGVIGEEGDPGFEEIEGRLYVSADADEETLRHLWELTQLRSPLLNTLKRCVKLKLELKISL